MEVMEELKQRILQDGLIIDNRILKIDNFLNQQIDTTLINHVGQEFARRFKDVHIDRIVTIKSIGIADPMGDITPTSLQLTVSVADWALNITQDVTFE